MSTLEMKDWNRRDYEGVANFEDEFEQIPMQLDANGKDMNYATKHAVNSERDARVQLAKEVKEKNMAFPKSHEARAGRSRGEIIITE